MSLIPQPEGPVDGAVDDSLHVLLIEDNPEDAFTVGRSLSRAKYPRFSLETAQTWTSGRSLLELKSTDVVLLDLHLPDGDGLDLVRDVARRAIGVPIIILTGMDDDRTAIEALQLGAQDYLVKSDIGTQTLRRAICHAIERQQILASLEQANRERIQMKDEFLSHVSHELLTPLSAIYQFVEILSGTIRESEVEAEQRMCLDVLLRNAVQLRRMIGDLMEATRLDTGKLALDLGVVDLASCIEGVAQAAQPELVRKKLELDTRVAEGLPPVLADDGRVRQVLGNLISNAIKFTPKGKSISLSADRSERSRDHVRVVVEDTGYGISEDALPRIFERLYQDNGRLSVSRKGIGIGLYICREVIRAMGGEIWVESQVDVGSRFHFTLPIFSTEYVLRSRIDASRPCAAILLVLECAPDAIQIDETLSAAASELHAHLARLVWNAHDVVLPRRGARDHREVIGVILQADASGARAAAARIGASAADMLEMLALPCGLSVRTHPLEAPRDPGGTVADLAARVDRILEKAMAQS